MKRALVVGSVALVLVLTGVLAVASDAEMYFASDRNGQNRVTDIQEGDSIWIVIYDPDENIDCDVRDKIWTDIKVMDPKTGAYITWISYPRVQPAPWVRPVWAFYDIPGYIPFQGHEPGNVNSLGDLRYDYLEETGADTGLFVSSRAFQVGTRELIVPAGMLPENVQTHVVDNNVHPDPGGFFLPGTVLYQDFNFGCYIYGGPGLLPGGLRGYIDATGAFVNPPGAPMAWGAGPPGWVVGTLPAVRGAGVALNWMVGHFENMDSLIGLYVDQNDDSDIACAMGKIIDTEASCSWDQRIYPDCNASAQITIVDPDENLDCNSAEFVPVFVIVNPGSWNPVDFAPPAGPGGVSPTTFCALKRTGGVNAAIAATGVAAPTVPLLGVSIQPWNIYNSLIPAPAPAQITNAQTHVFGSYYIEYPTNNEVNANVVAFDMTDLNGVVRVMFWAQETGPNTGEFQLNINSICNDLGFNSMNVNDVLVAYYLDPNDFDDFTLCVAYITEDTCHSATSFTDAMRLDGEEYWIGRDPIYVQVIDANANVDPCCPEQVVVHICDPHEEDDAEWVVLDETSSNSPVFFTNSGYQLQAVWDALGIGWWGTGDQLVLDNWKIEAYNEDHIYARYNDVIYVAGDLGLLGDLIGPDPTDAGAGVTIDAFPPEIRQTRVAEDVSFDMMEIADTQVFGFDGSVNMWFLDRQSNRVSGYTNSDCVFIEVYDPDQDEDQRRRERIDAFWAIDFGGVGANRGDNQPFGPVNTAVAAHPIPDVFGATGAGVMLGWNNIFARPAPFVVTNDWAMLYILNPRTGNWAAVDLLETAVDSGLFRSTICIDLVSQYPGVPTLGVIPGDTIIAVYQDPSNHSDSAWICIKVGCGGGGTPPGQASTTMFVDSAGNEVTSYTDADDVYVKVIDPSHAGATSLLAAVDIDGTTYDLMPLAGAATDTFITSGLSLGLAAGDSITATYTDPTDATDSSTDTISIIASVLDVVGFVVSPDPFEDEVTFSYDGTGVATTFSVSVYDVAGKLVWSESLANVTEVTWDGRNGDGFEVAKGAYIYVIVVSDGTNSFPEKDVFVRK